MALEVKDLKKSFKKRTVVNGVSLNISKGEIVGLLGPNGAGKSTSFYMIVGLLKPEKGSIMLNGDHSNPNCSRRTGVFLSLLAPPECRKQGGALH